VIISALRTPICKAKRGGLKDTPADDLLATVLKATLQQTGIEPAVSLRWTLLALRWPDLAKLQHYSLQLTTDKMLCPVRA